MNNEQQELLDEAYENYKSKINLQNNWEITLRVGGVDTIGQQELLSQEEFISKIKTDDEFSEKWGIKIEEQTILEQVDQNNPMLKGSTALYLRKLIIITYNEKTIESYE
jgi:hypothetical protein